MKAIGVETSIEPRRRDAFIVTERYHDESVVRKRQLGTRASALFRSLPRVEVLDSSPDMATTMSDAQTAAGTMILDIARGLRLDSV